MNTNHESFSSPSSGSSPYAAPGAQLRQARERRDLSLDEVATKTRVQRRYLQALEEGTVDKLPEPVYARGFLKKYADFLGLDSAGIAERYFPMAEIRKQGNSGPLLMPPAPKRTNWLGYTVGVVVAVLGLSTFFALGNKRSAPFTSETAQASGKSEPSLLEKIMKGVGDPNNTVTPAPAPNQVVANAPATQPAASRCQCACNSTSRPPDATHPYSSIRDSSSDRPTACTSGGSSGSRHLGACLCRWADCFPGRSSERSTTQLECKTVS